MNNCVFYCRGVYFDQGYYNIIYSFIGVSLLLCDLRMLQKRDGYYCVVKRNYFYKKEGYLE